MPEYAAEDTTCQEWSASGSKCRFPHGHEGKHRNTDDTIMWTDEAATLELSPEEQDITYAVIAYFITNADPLSSKLIATDIPKAHALFNKIARNIGLPTVSADL